MHINLMSSQIYVGTYDLNCENVDLYALPKETGGWFYTRPDDRNSARIKIGLNERNWNDVVAVLLHESFEFICARRGFRWDQSSGARGSDCYHFIMDHRQFSEVCFQQGWFLAKAMPDLARVFNKLKRKK